MILICVVLFALLLIFDQASKIWALTFLKGNVSQPFIPHILEFSYLENRGIAFGMFQNKHEIIIPITVVIMIVCIGLAVYYAKKKQPLAVISFVMILSGAVGNLIDKVRLGYVVDFIHTLFIDFPVFNLADAFICIGTGLFALFIIFFDKEEKNENSK